MTSVPPVTAGATSGDLTQAVWAAFLIEQINAAGGDVPLTLNNVQNIERWMVAEEPSTNWANRNNPLNASLGTSAADGTGSYANLTAAAVETAAMIRQSNMSAIYHALSSDASPSTFSAAVVSSPWASSHYGGNPNHIASIGLPSEVPVGSITKDLPADPGAVVNASPTPIGPYSGVNEGAGLFGLTGLEQGINTILTDITSGDFWKRLGLFTGGGVLIIIGIVVFISTTKTGQKVESDAAVAAVA